MKVLKDSAASSAMVIAGTDYTQLTAGPNSVTSTRDSGNYINGPLSISSPIENIRVGGIYKFNPQLATGLASTLITPIPTLVFDIPIKNLASQAAIASVLQGLF